MIPDSQFYNLSRRRLFGLLGLAGVGSVEARNRVLPEDSRPLPALFFDGQHAHATGYHPLYIHHIVYHANALAHLPYKVGGGHRELVDEGYDCSGSISYVLFRSGLLNNSLTSAQFAKYGNPGPGKYVTLYVKPGEHIFMTVCGLRYDTSGAVRHEGPRWRTAPRNYSGFQQRCIPGL
ncbi:peptidoglycan endopeptidase [Prosthecobacter sp.]|uniref:peptidoglycan endopeptidase n=1 Tax=Prosthecobacter sp. TaxID=1965333 RepID=UPI0037C7F4F6